MIYKVPPFDPDAPIIVIDIGNTTVTLATWQSDRLNASLSVPTTDQTAFSEAYSAHLDSSDRGSIGATVIASVVPEALERIREFIDGRQDKEPLVVGESVPLPIDVKVADPRLIGVDRVCAAAAAFDKLERGCTVVDFGSAVTVDLIDDDGVLLGGAIMPGIKMQLRALHEFTSALPAVEPGIPEQPYGRDTEEAMQTGVCRGMAGAVRAIVEGYASHLNHWPDVIATGGDVEFVAPHCDFLDTLVANLTLHGLGVAYRKHIATALG